MKQKHNAVSSVCLLALMALAGCSTNLNGAFQKGYGAVEYAKRTNIDLLNHDAISADEGMAVHLRTKQVEGVLDTAWQIKRVYADSSRTLVNRALLSVTAIIEHLTALTNEKEAL